ncbi:hypothetical protein E8E13_011559 [Curvularia kusanoi]|uniref:Uncharacterized protein n=1 Tax=Curvularia kusanoi TaxID=90978 RepID=A0A9P4TQ81_CURKU|nr:hypothetical protein E8E13_011559 [Curvularia kusanoi]
MKTAIYVALVTAAAPAAWSLPASVTRQFKLPTCGAETCLASTNGTFVATGASNGTAPSDLGRICSLPQEDVTRYVQTVQPCIQRAKETNICTAGAIDQYKDVLKDVCARPEYNKEVHWA